MALLTASKAPGGPPSVPVVPPAGPVASGVPVPVRDRLRSRLRSTPGRLSSILAGLVLLGLAAGVAALAGTATRAGQVDDVRTRSGPLTVTAQQLYRALSDADATAAAAFLSTGGEPADLRARYQSDIAAASDALATAAGSAGAGDRAAVATIATTLPIYTGLVETARANNRLNLPLGSAYLREASGLMRDQLLPAASTLYRSQTRRLDADRSGAAGLPWLAVPLLLLTLAGLVLAQRYLSRRTRRTFNIGALVATLAAVVLLGWLVLSWAGVSTHLDAGRSAGSAQVNVLAQARIAALQARADEAQTLVAHGNGAASEKDFVASMDTLAGTDGNGGLLAAARRAAGDPAVRAALDRATTAARDWRAVHVKLRALDDSGQYPQAVALAIGADPAAAAAKFTALDRALADGIGTASGAFDRQATAAAGESTGTTAGFVVLTGVYLTGLVLGLQRRIAEYR